MLSIFRKIIIILVMGLFIFVRPVKAVSDNIVNIYFFHSKDCSHCQSEIKILKMLEKKYSNVKIYKYEVHDSKNRDIYNEVRKLYNIDINGVPLTVIGNTYYQGYIEEKDDIIFNKIILYYSKYKYHDTVGELLELVSDNNYQSDEGSKSLEEFIDEYGNYRLIGNIYTNDLNPSLIAIILGVGSIINPFYIIFIMLGLIMIKREGNTNRALVLSISLFFISIIIYTMFFFNNIIYRVLGSLVLLLLVCRRKVYFKIGIVSFLGVFSSFAVFNSNVEIFRIIENLYLLTGFNRFNYYLNYLFILFATNLILIVGIYGILEFIKGRVAIRREK